MPASPIKTVIFDLGGVYFTDGVKHFIPEMQKKYGISEDKVREVIDGELGKKYRTAEITPEEFWQEAKNHWNLTVPMAEIANAWLEGYVPIEGTVMLIDKLRDSGYELLFLSDNAPDRVDYLESRYKFLHRFDGGIFSHITKVRKPHPKMYDAVLAIASSPASACVYFDDKEKQLGPAKALGMHAIQFVSPEQAESDLKVLGLQF